jgi:hypothetical protein
MSDKDKKLDLIKLFGVEGKIKPRTILDDTQEDLDNKTPFEITIELHKVIDMMNEFVVQGDVEGALKCTQAGLLRMTTLQTTVLDVKNILDKIEKKSKDDDDKSNS